MVTDPVPTVGGLLPVVGGLLPVVGGLLPVVGGLLPVVGGLLPVVGGLPLVVGGPLLAVGGLVLEEVCEGEAPPADPPPQADSVRPSAATAQKDIPRRDPRPRLAFLILPPNCVRPTAGLAGGPTIREIARSLQAAWRLFLHEVVILHCALIAHRARDHPGNPAVVGSTPLDRKFCDTRLSTGCAFHTAGDAAARVRQCNECARYAEGVCA
jgi:hypothetical protein